MRERPIIFSGEMVRAILDGRKTQTRRIINPQPPRSEWTRVKEYAAGMSEVQPGYFMRCKFGVAGDRLWVREAFGYCSDVNGTGFPNDRPFLKYEDIETPPEKHLFDYIIWRADGETEWADDDGGFAVRKDGSAASYWKPAIHMPRCASRISLEITKVRVERLQDISDTDILAEGQRSLESIDGKAFRRANFKNRWDSLHGKGAWDKNPWVWVVEFCKV